MVSDGMMRYSRTYNMDMTTNREKTSTISNFTVYNNNTRIDMVECYNNSTAIVVHRIGWREQNVQRGKVEELRSIAGNRAGAHVHWHLAVETIPVVRDCLIFEPYQRVDHLCKNQI